MGKVNSYNWRMNFTPLAFFDRFEKLRLRRAELEKLLLDPNLLTDIDQLQRLTREYREITEILNLLDKYRSLEKELNELTELAKDSTDQEMRSLAETEAQTLKIRLRELNQELNDAIKPRPPEWEKGCIVEIRAAAGGEEAALFAADLFRMYSRFAEHHHLQIEILSSRPSDLEGFREIIFSVEGKTPYRYFRFESGVHRVQRIPKTEAAGRIHTSTVTVAVLLEPEENELKINSEEIKMETFRAGGHGGQNVNKVSSAVRLTHLPTQITVVCQDERSQARNRAKAMKVLLARLSDLKRQEERKKTTEARRKQIGTGERSEKIRTYNFPQNRVTDHRINFSLYNLDVVLNGELDPLFNALEKAEAEL